MNRVTSFHLPPQAQRTFFVILMILLFSLFGMQSTRIPIIYLNASKTLGIPDHYFSQPTVAHDWNLNVADPGYLLQFGQPINWFWGYGYGPPIAYTTVAYSLSELSVCNMTASSCGYLLYKLLIVVCFIGFIAFSWIVPKELYKRVLTLLFFLTASLGIGFSRAVETGNLDLPISCAFAWITFLVSRHHKVRTQTVAIAALIGFVGGFVLTIKLAALPFLLIFILTSPKKIITILFFAVTFSLFSLAPNWYGIPSKLTDIYAITETTLAPMRKDVYTSYPHGNMSVRASASGLYHSLHFSFPDQIRNISIVVFSIGLLSVIVGPSLLYLYSKLHEKKNGVLRGFQFLRFVLLPEKIHYAFSLVCISLILFPIVAFEYRLIYFIPVFILLIAKEFEKLSRWFFLALFFYFIKNIWILHGSITTIMFYVSLVFLLFEITMQLWKSFVIKEHSVEK